VCRKDDFRVSERVHCKTGFFTVEYDALGAPYLNVAFERWIN